MQNSTRKIAYSVDDIVALVGIGRSLLFEELAAGRLAARKVGRRTIVLDADLSVWLERLPEKAGDSKQKLKTKTPK